MVYSHKNSKGDTYYLHSRGHLRYFSKDPKGAIDLPPELTVIENDRTKLPIVKKK
ncbi:MAG: hypothetical protein AB1467_03305 [Candidatus Diapherotrites archaeon]